MKKDHEENVVCEEIPEAIYQNLIARQRKVCLETALTVKQHREIVKRERAAKKC